MQPSAGLRAAVLLGVFEYDDWPETGFGTPNLISAGILAYQTPRQVRVGLRFEF